MNNPRANYAITRIDQPEKKNHGFYVRISHNKVSHQKYFPDKSLGGKKKALVAARSFRDELLKKMPDRKQEAASRKKRRIMHSGVTGVTHVMARSVNGKNYDYWQAAWIDVSNQLKTAKFSISRYGSDVALAMALQARKEGERGKR